MATKGKPLAGKTITLPVFIQARQARPFEEEQVGHTDGFVLYPSQVDYTLKGEFNVLATSVTFTVPADFDPVGPMVASIEAEKAKITAEFTARVSELNRRLSELQAIEHTPEAA